MRKISAQCDPPKPYFYKGNTLSKRVRAQQSRAQIQVCVSTKQRSFLWHFGLCFCCHTFPLKCLFSLHETRVGPEPAFRWTPNRPSFGKTVGPHPPVRYVYIYIYMANASKCASFFQYIQVKRYFWEKKGCVRMWDTKGNGDTDRMRREDREKDKERNYDGEIEMERS